MDCEGSLPRFALIGLFNSLKANSVIKPNYLDDSFPLGVDEVIDFFRKRWNVAYDVKLVVRSKTLYFQVMWAYLEQQSFPLNEQDYRNHLATVLEVINRLGQADVVRKWLEEARKKPRPGRALSLKLDVNEGFEEFVL